VDQDIKLGNKSFWVLLKEMVNKLGRISKDLNISLECKRNNNITLKAT
jgi:hypothetical protein